MEAREFLGEMGHGSGGTTFTTAGIEGVAFIFRFDQTAGAVSRVVAVIDQDGMFRGGVIFGVEPGIADGVINVAIVIDIASGDIDIGPERGGDESRVFETGSFFRCSFDKLNGSAGSRFVDEETAIRGNGIFT